MKTEHYDVPVMKSSSVSFVHSLFSLIEPTADGFQLTPRLTEACPHPTTPAFAPKLLLFPWNIILISYNRIKFCDSC